MKLSFDRKSVEYSPSVGLNLFPGTHDYPDDKVDGLIAAGLKKVPEGEAVVPAIVPEDRRKKER